MFLCEIGSKKVTLQTLVSDRSVRQLFELITRYSFIRSYIPNIEQLSSNVFSRCRDVLVPETGRVDFFGSYAADHVDGGLMAKELQTIMQV